MGKREESLPPGAEESFGPNSWLIEEMYQQYLDSPSSVGEAWRDFFADYQPSDGRPAEQTESPKAPEPVAAKAPTPPKEEPSAPEAQAAPLRGADAALVKH